MKVNGFFLIIIPVLTFAAVHGQTNPAISTSKDVPPAAADECGCDSGVPDVLAVVNGVKVTKQEIDAANQRIAALKKEIVDARKSELDLQINSWLLKTEARKRGVSLAQLLQTEVVDKTAAPTEADAQAFYDQNKAQIAHEFKAVSNDIISYLRTLRQQAEAKRFADQLRAAATLSIANDVITPPATELMRQRIFALVNGHGITSGDIEDSLRAFIFSVQGQIYDLRKHAMDLKINDTLLEAEAAKQNSTGKALLENEVYSKLPAVTEAEAQKYYDENKARLTGEFPQLKAQIIQYLTDEEKYRLTGEYAGRLRAAAQLQIFLAPPEPPKFNIAVDDQPSIGSLRPKVTIVAFTDYQCEACSPQHQILHRLVSEYLDRVRLIIRDFPLKQHQYAVKAAEAAEAAREQGKFWEYAMLLFRSQRALQVENLKLYASELRLDRARFDAALDAGKFREQVQRDALDGGKLGISTVPAVFVNGQRVSDLTYEGLKARIEKELKANP